MVKLPLSQVDLGQKKGRSLPGPSLLPGGTRNGNPDTGSGPVSVLPAGRNVETGLLEAQVATVLLERGGVSQGKGKGLRADVVL